MHFIPSPPGAWPEPEFLTVFACTVYVYAGACAAACSSISAGSSRKARMPPEAGAMRFKKQGPAGAMTIATCGWRSGKLGGFSDG
jgi:hypothetical protein